MTKQRFTIFTLLVALFAGLLAAVSADDDKPEAHRANSSEITAILQEATGLDASALREALESGATPAELIEANDGDVAAVSATIAETAKAAIETAMNERSAEISETLSEWLKGDEGRRRRGMAIPRGAILTVVEEATGLNGAGLRAALAEGATPAELIEANGGDVAAVMDALAAEIATATDEQKAQRLAQIADQVSAWMNGPRGPRYHLSIGGSAAQAIMEEATGLDAAGLREALEAGATPTDLIEANGGDVSEVMDALFAEAQDMRARMKDRFHEMQSRFGDMFGKFARGFWGEREHTGRRG